MQRHHQKETSLFVLQKQVLGVPARDRVVNALGLRDGKDSPVVPGRRLDAEAVEKGQKVGSRRRHGTSQE
jgi:hypothetical protein